MIVNDKLKNNVTLKWKCVQNRKELDSRNNTHEHWKRKWCANISRHLSEQISLVCSFVFETRITSGNQHEKWKWTFNSKGFQGDVVDLVSKFHIYYLTHTFKHEYNANIKIIYAVWFYVSMSKEIPMNKFHYIYMNI